MYRIEHSGEGAISHETFSQEFTDEYPFAPVTTESTSEEMFQRNFIKRLCSQMAMRFYDHEFSEKID